MVERRRFLRFNTSLSMEYRICDDKEMSGASYIKNLSREGLGLSLSRKIENGISLAIKFLLPQDTRPIYLTGEVVWSREYEEKNYMVGVKFSKIDGFDRMRLVDHAYTEWLKSSRDVLR